MARRRIPPLNALYAFESVAEHGSISAAARARGVAQPSISRHIAVLEDWLSVSLLDRQANSVALTADGEELSRTLRDAFDQIELTVRRLQERHAAPVVLGCSSAIAYLWLFPLLPSLREHYPEADLSLFSSENYADFDRSAVDLSIRFGSVTRFPSHAICLIPERAFPVMSPELAKERGLHARSTPADYRTDDLLHHTRGTYGWLNWPAYYEARGHSFRDFDTISSYNNYSLLIDRALAGEGIVMGHAGPIDQFLSSGRLVQVGAPVEREGFGFFLLEGGDKIAKPATPQIRDWLIGQSPHATTIVPEDHHP